MIKKVKDLKPEEIGYSKDIGEYYFGNKDAQDDNIKDIEVELQEFDNKKQDYTTLDSLLNGAGVTISMNSYTLKDAIRKPKSILCSYDGEVKDGDKKVTRWSFVDPIGYNEFDETVYSFNSYGHIDLK